MANYTKGPWMVQHEMDGDIVISDQTSEGVFVARIPNTWLNKEENAHLIAAAPELLEALLWVSAALQAACSLGRPIRESQNIRTPKHSKKIAAILDDADAAIAKALNKTEGI